MKIYEDILKSRQRIVSSINAHGFSPDHNYYNYLYTQNADKKCIFLDFGKARGILAFFSKEKGIWRVINGVFAPQNERLGIFMEFLDWAFEENKSAKVFAEFAEDFKSELFKKLKASYKMNASYSLYWPVYNLDNLDEKLSGKEWKKLRNIRNRFINSYRIEVKNPKKVDKKALIKVLLSWTKKRYPRDRANFSYYSNIIQNKFEGLDALRAISLDGEVCSFSGGWMVPNSSDFYYAIGIFNYRHKYLGDFINLDDLLHLKKLGFKQIELGGSDQATILFKKKFNPIKIYKTTFFSICPK